MKRCLLILVPAVLLLCFALSACTNRSASDEAPESTAAKSNAVDYESTLFDTSYVHEIDVSISDEDWADLLANPVDKTKYEAAVTIDGEKLENVAFSTKGNSSLIFVAADPDSDRYSFKIGFGKNIEGQTFHGLDTLCLNNSFCDATYMKDYICYGLFRKAGVPAPLTSYAWLTVNGEDRGLYLAVEAIDEGFLDRVYGGNGVIYKPESSDLGLSLDDARDIAENGLTMTTNAQGSELLYVDDDPESYPDIFENAETEADESDDLEVVDSLKILDEGTKLDTGIDVDEVIQYFTAHNFVLNLDSYTGGMLHNIVLYENEGKMAMLPWDYNLAFATFIPGTGREVLENPTDIVNQGIDTPLIGASEETRPMWSWIVSDEQYRDKYHEALGALISDYFESGDFNREITELTDLLTPYVKKDPTAFYSADEFKRGCETLKEFCNLRAESIRLQLDGSLSSDSESQADADKVDASGIDVIDMGAYIDTED